jgi:ubiquinone/menaquinone biosynthesis C-methylase UbiE
MELTPATREFHWISSVEGDKVVLESLHEAMMSFYAEAGERSEYQDMLDDIKEDPEGDTSTTRLAECILEIAPESVLEVGCGNGRLFRTMVKRGVDGDYTGVEVAEYVIEGNRDRHPEARWDVADAYDLPADGEEMDLVCAEFVLEHLVFPRQALEEMMRVVRPGGALGLDLSGLCVRRTAKFTDSRVLSGTYGDCVLKQEWSARWSREFV